MKKICLALVSLMLAVLLCACKSQNTVQTVRQIDVVIHIECDAVYSVGVHYCVDRKLLGGQECMGDPSRTHPLNRNESISFAFTEMDFEAAENFGSGLFGVAPEIASADGEYIPLGILWEWNAQYGEKYHFTLTGSRESGFRLEPTNADEIYAQIPLEEVVFK